MQDFVADCCASRAAIFGLLGSLRLRLRHDVGIELLEPGMSEGLLPRQSVIRIGHQQLSYQIFALSRDFFKLSMIKVEVRAGNLFQQCVHVFALKWKISASKRVEDHAK